MEIGMKTAGERIRRLRDEKDWNQIELAKKAHINNSVMSRIEAGKRPIEDDLLVKFANIFGVTTDYLLGRTDDPGKPNDSPTPQKTKRIIHSLARAKDLSNDDIELIADQIDVLIEYAKRKRQRKREEEKRLRKGIN